MTDAADASTSDGVMIAFLPTTSDWCKIDLPHMTLVYAGVKSDLTPTDFNSLAKDAATIALLTSPFALNVKSVDVYGEGAGKVNALNFTATPELLAMRRTVEKWNKSEFSFNPHATIGPVTDLAPIYPPPVVGFNKIMVGWGDEQIVFNLNNKY